MQFEPQVPLDGTRHDMTLTGAAFTEDNTLRVEARIDNGPLKGKRITTDFERLAELKKLAVVLDVVIKSDLKNHIVKYLEDVFNTGRFSAEIRVREEYPDWGDSERVEYRYSLREFDEPQRPAELVLAQSFTERRKKLKREKL